MTLAISLHAANDEVQKHKERMENMGVSINEGTLKWMVL